MLIGFGGPLGSGKTDAAKMAGGVVLSFATPLKRAAKDLFMFSDEQIYTQPGKEAIDPRWGVSPRYVLQWLGTDCIRARFPKFWVQRMAIEVNSLLAMYHDELIIIDDLRFPDEADYVRSVGGTVVTIIGRSKEVDQATMAHVSEQGYEARLGDITLDNSGSLHDLRRKVDRIVAYVRTGQELDW